MIGWRSYVDDANFIFDFWMQFAKGAIKNHSIKKNDSDNTGYHNSLVNLYCDKINECSDPQSSFYGEIGGTCSKINYWLNTNIILLKNYFFLYKNM